jgi:DsbC/DsbD-like thiol-disulfide interchange protein
MRLFCLALSLIFMATAPLWAGETPWQEVAPGVSVRMISAGTVSSSGKTMAAIEFSMPEDTKTYWRVPGQAGLPTELDLTGSHGVEAHSVLWPYPVRHEANGVLDYVYFGDTVLPIELTVAGGDARLILDATMGICSEICVPALASFELALSDTSPDRANGLRIRQALAEVPLAWGTGAAPLGSVEIAPAGDAIAVVIDPETVDPKSVIAATSSGLPLFGAPQKSPKSDLVLLPVLGKSAHVSLRDLDVQLTFLTDRGAFEVHRVVGDAVSD